MWYLVGAAAALIVGALIAGLYMRDRLGRTYPDDVVFATVIVVIGAMIWPVALPAAITFAAIWLIAGPG